MRLKKQSVEAGKSFLWPPEGSPELKAGSLAPFSEHRFDIDAAGAGVASVKYRSYAGQTLKTVVPPIDWTTPETLLQSGVYQFELTATTDTCTFDIDSNNG